MSYHCLFRSSLRRLHLHKTISCCLRLSHARSRTNSPLESSTPRRLCFIDDFYKSLLTLAASLLSRHHQLLSFLLSLHFYSLDTTSCLLLYAPFTTFFVSSLALRLHLASKRNAFFHCRVKTVTSRLSLQSHFQPWAKLTLSE